MRIVDRTNVRYGRLVALELLGERSDRRLVWRCVCDCGALVNVRGSELGSSTSSCGCLQKDMASKRFRKHGMKRSPEYRSWYLMIDRCENPNGEFYHCYGGRGITVCKEWREDFRAFFADMGSRPSTKHSLDRIDTNSNYTPENCKWSDQIQQANNRRNNRIIVVEGSKLTIADAARKYGRSYSSVADRLRRGKSIEHAVGLDERRP